MLVALGGTPVPPVFRWEQIVCLFGMNQRHARSQVHKVVAL